MGLQFVGDSRHNCELREAFLTPCRAENSDCHVGCSLCGITILDRVRVCLHVRLLPFHNDSNLVEFFRVQGQGRKTRISTRSNTQSRQIGCAMLTPTNDAARVSTRSFDVKNV
jgi:hypothetical protein